VATPGPGPSKSRSSQIPRCLRERYWFWPKAAWIGFGWFGRIVDHPLSSFFAWVLALATIFLGGVALHVSPVIIFIAVVIVFMFVVARGARLKWEQDVRRVNREQASTPAPHIGTYHAHGPTFLAATPDLLRQIGSLEPRSTAPDPGPVRPGQLQEPQAGGGRADDQVDDAGDEEPSQ